MLILVLTKILSGITVFNINNYEGSFDTEDWSNSYWKNNFTAGIHYIVKYIKIEDFMEQKNAAWLIITDFKNIKTFYRPNF